jgi:ABC-type branched-subunit amino acid transport system substrate-binding protein/cytochrome c553
MKRLERLIWLAALVFPIALSTVSWSSALAQDSLTLSERRGKQIYVQGTSSSAKEILAYVGESSLEMPASSMACANCHGLDGQGKPEGSINPSDIRPEFLTKPYGVTHPDGRKHPPYTGRGLELAITRGTDPAGNRLLSVMPRYAMSREDLADLIAYLGRLGKDRDPGISESSIVIATAVPASGPLAEMGQAIKAVTSAFFDNLNSQGGVFSRHVEVKFVETAETAAGTRANFERLLMDEPVFAMSGAFIAGSEKVLVPLMAQKEVPLIGPLTLYPQTGFPLNRQVFYLLSGIDVQACTLIHFAAGRPELKNLGLVVVYSQSEVNATVVEAIKEQSKKDGLSPPQIYGYATRSFNAVEAVRQFKQTGRDAVFFLGNVNEAVSLMREADELGWFPTIFLPGASGAGEIFSAPVGFSGKVFLSFPTSPADQTADGLREFRALAEKYKLPAKHVAAQLSAYCAAKILVEALKRAGKDLSREKLIRALEGFYEYPTGLTPAITYGPNRRVGAMGAYVITLDLKQQQFLPASGWININ